MLIDQIDDLKRLSRSAFESDGSHVTLYILNVNGVTRLQPCFWKNQDEKMTKKFFLRKKNVFYTAHFSIYKD